MLDCQRTVADVVLSHSETAAVFARHRIDFCCRGDVSVEAAAAQRGVPLATLQWELEKVLLERRRGLIADDPRAFGTPRLIAHIITTHHACMRHALPYVQVLSAKVARVHGAGEPHLKELAETVNALVEVLLPHLDEEEAILFPALLAAEADPAGARTALSGIDESHGQVAELLQRIRALTSDYALPDGACRSYRTLFAELRGLEADMVAHVHLETNVLIPRFEA